MYDKVLKCREIMTAVAIKECKIHQYSIISLQMGVKELECEGRDWNRVAQDSPVVGSCEHSNELMLQCKDQISIC
jgi:hypothetical protein